MPAAAVKALGVLDVLVGLGLIVYGLWTAWIVAAIDGLSKSLTGKGAHGVDPVIFCFIVAAGFLFVVNGGVLLRRKRIAT